MAASANSQFLTAVLLFAAALCAAVGVLLVRRGWWPRRRGDQPHCRACDYLLVNNESGRCPECGADIRKPSNIVRGARRRRGGVAAVGMAFCAVALLCVVGGSSDAVGRIDWYQYRPAGWVVEDALSPNAAKADRAWAELDRRRGAGRLSDAIGQRLIRAALTEQAKPRPSRGPHHQRMVDSLANAFLDGKLTAEQADEFFTLATRRELRVRPAVALGDAVPFEVAAVGSEPTPGKWWRKETSLGVWVDGRQVQPGSGGGSGTSMNDGTWGSSAKVDTPGPHTIEVRERLEIFVGRPDGSAPTGPPAWAKDVVLRGQTQVVPKGEAAPVKLLDRPDLASLIQSRLKVIEFRYDPPTSPTGNGSLPTRLDIGTMPENVAFELFARTADGIEHALGAITVRKGKSTGYHVAGDLPKGGDVLGNSVDFVFRSSEAVARRTVDMTEIWRGEIVVQGVAVKRKTAGGG